MSVGDGSEPIADDEVVYRRVSVKSEWYDPGSGRPVAWSAFKPNENDADGISVWRATYKSAYEVARATARASHSYYVISLRAGSLRGAGISVEPTPQHGEAGHASLANLNARAYAENKDTVQALARRMASELVEKVEGPFGPFDDV